MGKVKDKEHLKLRSLVPVGPGAVGILTCRLSSCHLGHHTLACP